MVLRRGPGRRGGVLSSPGSGINPLPKDSESPSALILRTDLSLYSELHQEDIELLSQLRIVPESLAIRLDHPSAELRVALNPGFQALPGKTHHHCLSIHADMHKDRPNQRRTRKSI